MARFHSYTDAESITSAQSVIELHFPFQLAVRRRFQNLLVHNRDIPLRQIFSSHRPFAGGKEPSLAFIWSETWWAKSKAPVAGRICRISFLFLRSRHTFHSEGNENLLP